MKKILYFFIILFLVSCNNGTQKSDICNKHKKISKDTNVAPLFYFKDIEDAIECSKITKKPVLVMFYGELSANRDYIWQNIIEKDIVEIINDKYNFVLLAATDSSYIRTGNDYQMMRNYDLEIFLFNTNEQPLCVVLNYKKEIISDFINFETLINKKELLEFLNTPFE